MLTTPTVRALVVEPNRHVAKSLQVLLKVWGCRVRVCTDPARAAAVARRFRPEVVLADVTFGTNVIADDGFDRPRLVGLTARAGRYDGYDDVLRKPLDPEALERAVFGAAVC